MGSGYGDSSGSWRNRQSRFPNQANDPAAERERQEFRDLTPALVERIEDALKSPDGAAGAAIEDLRKREASIHVTASRRNNMVVVRTSDSRALKEIRDLVTRMDVPTPLVLLEVQVVNIQLGRDFRSAFDYQFSDGANAAAFARGAIPPNPDGGVLPAIGFRARMQLFEEKNRVHTLASPVLLTANNEVSRLFLGEERPIVRNVSSQTILTNENVATTPNTEVIYRPVGNTLLITPNINSDRTVTLRLVQENSFIKPNDATIPVITNGVGSSTNVSEIKVDVVATRSISGTFVAKDGMAVAAGGLIESGIGTNRGQVPVLGSIPGVGLLFRRQEDTNSRNELVIMIRPHVLSTPADGERISREMLGQLAPGAVQKLLDEGILPEGPDLRDLPLPQDPIGEILPGSRPLFTPELPQPRAPRRPSAPTPARNPHQGLLKK
jgi:general secretion pathway protein D